MNDREIRNEPETLEPAAPLTTLRPFQIVWKHKGLVSLGVAIGAVLGTLYYVQARPVYQSSAQILVVKKRPDALPLPGSDARVQYVEDYLATHQVMIRSPLIVGEAIRDGKLHDLESFAGGGDPTGKIIEGLKVVREVKDNQPTNILYIVFRGPVSADCKTVVNAVIESYRKSLNKTYENVSEETADLITKAKELLATKLTVADDNYKKFRLDHPFLWKSKEGVSLIQDRLQNIEVKRSGLLVRQTEIEGRIALFKNALAQKRSREEMLAMVAQSSGRLAAESGRVLTEDRLQILIQEEATLREELGKDHPRLKAVQKQIAFYREQRDHANTKDDNRSNDPILAHLLLLEREAEDAKYGADGMARLLKSEQEEAKKLVSLENQDEGFRNEISRNQQLLESISKRLSEVNILKSFGGFFFQIISPSVGGSKVGPNPMPIFAVACLLGAVVGFGMAYLAEISDQSFRNPEEIRKQLGLPIIGHIPFFDKKEGELQKVGPEGVAVNPVLCTVYRSKSREAESYRVVRTSLYFSHHGQGHKLVQVTSPDMGDGKSTLAANLAVSIAQSGKSILLIDADFRRPRAHKMFNMKPTKGLASVIMEQAELPDVIQATAVPGLSVLPCGPIPNNPAELLTQPRLKEVLDHVREKFDFVIVDTPPLLAVTDPSIVAPLVDAVIITVRISKNGRPHAKRARDILTSLGANVLGVVVNGVGRDAEGYGYDKYHYGYTYRSNEYSYASYDDDAYHKPEPTDAAAAEEEKKKKAGSFFAWLFKN